MRYAFPIKRLSCTETMELHAHLLDEERPVKHHVNEPGQKKNQSARGDAEEALAPLANKRETRAGVRVRAGARARRGQQPDGRRRNEISGLEVKVRGERERARDAPERERTLARSPGREWLESRELAQAYDPDEPDPGLRAHDERAPAHDRVPERRRARRWSPARARAGREPRRAARALRASQRQSTHAQPSSAGMLAIRISERRAEQIQPEPSAPATPRITRQRRHQIEVGLIVARHERGLRVHAPVRRPGERSIAGR